MPTFTLEPESNGGGIQESDELAQMGFSLVPEEPPKEIGSLAPMQAAFDQPLPEGGANALGDMLTAEPSSQATPINEKFSLFAESPDNIDAIRGADTVDVLKAIPDVTLGGAKRGMAGLTLQSARSPEAAIIAAGKGDWFSAMANIPGLISRLVTPDEAAEERRKKLEGFGTELAAEGQAQIEEATPEGMGFWQEAVLTAGSSLGQTLPAMALGTVTRQPIPVTIGGLSLLADGQAYVDAVEAGVDPAAAFRHATASGILEGATEFLPAKVIFKRGTEAWKRAVNFLAAELPGENVAEVGQLFSEAVNGLRDEVTAQDVVDTMKLTSAATLIGGGAQVGIANAAHKVADVIDRKRQVRAAEWRKTSPSPNNPTPLPEPTYGVPEGITPTPYQYGEYTPIPPEYFGMLQEQQLRDEELRQYGEDYPPEGTVFKLPQEDKKVWGPQALENYNRRNAAAGHIFYPGQATQDFLDNATTTGGGERLVDLNMQPGDIASVGFDAFSEDMGELDLRVQLSNYGFTNEEIFGELLHPDNYNSEAAQQRLQEVKQKAIQAQRRMRDLMQETLQEWQKVFLPETKLIISDGTANYLFDGTQLAPETNGQTYAIDQGYAVIEVNGGSFLKEFLQQELMGANPYTSAMAKFHETLAHEFGHQLFGQTISSAPQHVRKAIYGAYENLLAHVAHSPDAPLRPFLDNWMGQGRAEKVLRELAEAAREDSSLEGAIDKLTVKHYLDLFADGPDYILSFDEFVADQVARYMAVKGREAGLVGSFWQKLGKRLRAFYNRARKHFPPHETFETFLDMAVAGRRIQDMRERIAAQIRRPEHTAQPQKRIWDIIQQAFHGKTKMSEAVGSMEPDMPSMEDLQGELDRYNKAIRTGFSLTQLAQQNKHIQGLQDYLERVRQWWNTKITWTARADERLQQWRDLSRDEGKRMADFLFDLTLKSDELGRKLNTEEFLELAEQYKLTDDMISLYDGIESDMDASLDAIKRVRMAELQRTYVNNPVALQQQMNALDKEFAKLRDRNYFPLSRFGQFVVQVKADRRMEVDGRWYDIGEVISFETFEGRGDAQKHHEELKKKYPKGTIVSLGKLSENAFQFSGMPPQLVTMIKNTLGIKEGETGPDVISLEEFNEMLYKISPARSFTKHLLQRKGTAGFSLDAMRGYADYFSRFANHIARIEHYAPLQDAINSVRKDAGMLFKQGIDSTKRTEIADHMTRHFEYAMNPQNELANLRAVGFMWYLGFLPKSAVVNFTQVPLVAYPHLAAKFGDAKTVPELVKAMKAAWKMWRDPDSLEPDLREALSRGVIDGFLDESLATELAAVAEGGVLQRYTAGTVLGTEAAGRMIRTGSYYGSWLFQQAEKVNRRITFIAAYRLARQGGQNATEAYITARDAVASTQYEYARWNRAEFMRGKKSIVFLFWQYIQNTAYFAFGGDAGWWRFWLMMLAMGGAMGLPFAENAIDLINYALKTWGGKAGWKNPEADVRAEMREFVKDLGVNPDLAMHGFSRYSFGLPQVFAGAAPEWAPEWMGQSDAFRGFDLSASLSMGDVIPGVKALTSDMDKDTKTLRAFEDVGGAALGIPFAIMQAAMDDHPDGFKRWERAMPSAVKSAVKAFNYATEGEATTRRGAEVVPFNIGDPYHRAEIIGQALGFTPTRLAQAREADWAARQALSYWETRRRLIMQDYTWARMNRDKEATRAAKDMWHKYNSQVPKNGLKISGKDMSASLRSRMRAQKLEEKGLPKSPRYRGLYEEVYEGFPNAE